MFFKNIDGVPDFECKEYSNKKHEYCVLIPIINEGDRIHNELNRALNAKISSHADIIICDGGSTDGSTDDSKLQNLDVNTLLVKKGDGKQGAQLRMGIYWALERGYKGIITIDGNNKDSIEDIPLFIKKLEDGYDLVQGSRFVKGGIAENTPLSRWIAVRFIHAPIISLTAGKWYTDTTNAYRAYSKRYLTHPDVQPLRDIFTGYELLAFLSSKANQLGMKTCEIPVARRYPKGDVVPTKISKWKGNLNLINILLSNLFGAYEVKHTTRNDKYIKYVNFFLLLLIIVGIIWRITDYCVCRSIWIDESMLAKSIITKDILSLCSGTLDYGQSSPLGFVLIAKISTMLFGANEYALRIITLLASLCSIFITYHVSKKYLKSPIPLLPTAIIAVGNLFIMYSNNFKPYSFDVLFTLLAVLVYSKYKRGDISLLSLSIIYSTFIWMSFGTIFTIGGICLYHAIERITTTDYKYSNIIKEAVKLLPFFLILFSVILYYLIWLQPSTQNLDEDSQNFWKNLAFPIIPKSFDDIKLIIAMIKDHLRIQYYYIFHILVAGVVFSIVSKVDRWTGISFLISWIMIIVVSSFGFFPIAARLQLFMLALLGLYGGIIISKAVYNIAFNKYTLLLTIIVVFIPITLTSKNILIYDKSKFYYQGEEFKECQSYIDSNIKSGEWIYYFPPVRSTMEFYLNYPVPNVNWETPTYSFGNCISGKFYRVQITDKPYAYQFGPVQDEIEKQADIISSHDTVYLLSLHEEAGTVEWMIDALNKRGKVSRVYNFLESNVYLFEKK